MTITSSGDQGGGSWVEKEEAAGRESIECIRERATSKCLGKNCGLVGSLTHIVRRPSQAYTCPISHPDPWLKIVVEHCDILDLHQHQPLL